jgi:hypothetical protein
MSNQIEDLVKKLKEASEPFLEELNAENYHEPQQKRKNETLRKRLRKV